MPVCGSLERSAKKYSHRLHQTYTESPRKETEERKGHPWRGQDRESTLGQEGDVAGANHEGLSQATKCTNAAQTSLSLQGTGANKGRPLEQQCEF